MGRNSLRQDLDNFDERQIDAVFSENLRFHSTPINRATVQRVALFSESFIPKIDGVSKSAYITLRYLQQTGREVLIFAPDVSPSLVGPSRVVALPSVGFNFAPETRIAFPSWQIRQELDAFQPDLIHLFSPAMMCASGMIEGRRRNIPVVANYQTDLPGYARQHYGFNLLAQPLTRWLRYIHNRSHVNLVASPTTLNQLQRDGFRRLHLWKRGVDTTSFHPNRRSQAMRHRLLNGRDPNSLLCVYVGRLAPEKCVDLLRGVADLPGVALTIVGNGVARSDLEALFAGTNTHFTGYLFGDELAEAYASADVFLFPGPNETFGQVVQEGMASGLPCVVVNRGGVRDLIVDGENGYLCEPNRESFAAAVKSLQMHSEHRRRMKVKSRQFAEDNTWQSVMAQLEGYYAQAQSINHRYQGLYHDLGLIQRWSLAG